ncbi:MAG: peptidoglycan-binding protein, partial [Clostridia bacterium]|nr:peptidoglycan-binding protein [Clostridia bacterium]
GVVQRRIADTSFTHWARLAVDDDAPAQAAPEPTGETRRQLSYGMQGEAVKTMQERLIEQGYSLAPDGADGYFGAVTLAAVRLFQRREGLAVDGIVGPKTWAALEGANA